MEIRISKAQADLEKAILAIRAAAIELVLGRKNEAHRILIEALDAQNPPPISGRAIRLQ